jgi:hypothetical protein
MKSNPGLLLTSMGVDVKTNQSTRPKGVASDGRRLESRRMVEARQVVRQAASRIDTGWRLPCSDPALIDIQML